jgi:hypothetical protein
MIPMSTPFDENSVDLCVDLGLPIIKIASANVNDWVLLNKVAQTKKPVIASFGGTSLHDCDSLVQFFQNRNIPLAINHCVCTYPTKDEDLQLNQIDFLKERFSLFNPKNDVVTIFVSDRKAEGTVIQKHNIICSIMSDNGWVLKSQKIWVKKEDTIDMFRHGYTFILTFGRNNSKHPLLPDVFSEKFVPATPEYTYNFSPNIVKQFIEKYTNKNEIVFDPFMGSGTTGRMCEKMNRRWIGFELNEAYVPPT